MYHSTHSTKATETTSNTAPIQTLPTSLMSVLHCPGEAKSRRASPLSRPQGAIGSPALGKENGPACKGPSLSDDTHQVAPNQGQAEHSPSNGAAGGICVMLLSWPLGLGEPRRPRLATGDGEAQGTGLVVPSPSTRAGAGSPKGFGVRK